jgi:hypothetical protein
LRAGVLNRLAVKRSPLQAGRVSLNLVILIGVRINRRMGTLIQNLGHTVQRQALFGSAVSRPVSLGHLKPALADQIVRCQDFACDRSGRGDALRLRRSRPARRRNASYNRFELFDSPGFAVELDVATTWS